MYLLSTILDHIWEIDCWTINFSIPTLAYGYLIINLIFDDI